MGGLRFANTNVIIYAVGNNSVNQAIARKIIIDGVVFCAQVIDETASVLNLKKSD